MHVDLRIATYNIHRCRGLDRRVIPSRTADVIADIDADVVALQEVVGADASTPGHAEGYGIPFFPRDLLHVLDLRNRLALVHATGQVPAPPGANKCGKCALRGDCQRASALLGWEAPPLDQPSVVIWWIPIKRTWVCSSRRRSAARQRGPRSRS